MGIYAAHCMAGVQDQTGVAMAFELFTHATRFMGHKASGRVCAIQQQQGMGVKLAGRQAGSTCRWCIVGAVRPA